MNNIGNSYNDLYSYSTSPPPPAQAEGSVAADVTAETMQRLEKMSLAKVQRVSDETQPSVDTARGQSLALESLFGSEPSKKPGTIDKATKAVVANPQARLDCTAAQFLRTWYSFSEKSVGIMIVKSLLSFK